MKIRLLLAALLAFMAMPAAADCTWEWLCTGDGVCKHMPVCESLNEIPPAKPRDSQPPATPPTSMRPFKVAGPQGGLTCEHIMRKGKSGRWYWEEACFCSDATKAIDPSAPFANIVRCDGKEPTTLPATERSRAQSIPPSSGSPATTLPGVK